MKLTIIEQVQKRVGMLPAPRDLKVIDYVDEHAGQQQPACTFGYPRKLHHQTLKHRPF